MKNMNLYTYVMNLGQFKNLFGFLLCVFLSQIAYSQTMNIKGRIIDAQGNPLSGATVVVEDTNIGAISNSNGTFQLKDISRNAILIARSIGYETLSIQLEGQEQLTITLHSKTNTLDETIIRAYGTTTRRLNTGAIGKVTAKEIAMQPVANPLAALAGRVPGLVVTQSNGVPGSAFMVQIRGQNSIAQGSEPLFVIDGVPFAPGNTSINGLSSALGSGGLSPFNSINPSDIKSIEVLKDADATAIYGSRGANGVILITTKKGKVGKSKINLNVYSGYSKITKMTDFLNTQQYLIMRREAFMNDGIIPNVNNAPDLLLWDTTRYTNFKKLLIGGTAKVKNIQASISGGSKQTQFLMSGNYHHQTTVYPGDLADNRATFHVNLQHHSINEKFTASLAAFYTSDNDHINSSDLTAYLNLSPNTPPLYDSTGHLSWQKNGVIFINPLAYLLQDYVAQTDNLFGNLQLSYRLFPGLSLKVNTGYNKLHLTEVNTNPITSQNPAYNPKGYSQFGDNKFTSWIIEPQVEYVMAIRKLNLDLLLGGTWQEKLNNSKTFFAYGYTNDEMLKSISAASSISVIGNYYSQYRYEAFFGRLNLNWDDRYVVNISGRRDGSSRFGPGKQFGNFGAIGLAWLFSNESFIKDKLSFLSFGKLRGSYGTTGNDQIRDYQYLDSWSNTNYPYQDISGLYPTKLFSPSYGWEVNHKLEAAIELGLFKDKIFLTVDYFRNRSSNQLIAYTLPVQTGFRNITRNFPATVENKGWEFKLTTSNVYSNYFHWTTTLNFTIPENRLIKFPGLETSSYASKYVIGESLSIVKGFDYIGVDPKRGVFRFKDTNKDGTVNSKDRVILGNRDPEFYGGIGNGISYKSLQLNIFLEFRKQWGENYLASIYRPYSISPGEKGNQPVVVLNRWQKPGDKANFQQFTTTVGTDAYNVLNYFKSSDGVFGDASFVRLKTLALSYQCPDKWLKKIHIDNTRIYLQAQNLFTLTRYKGTDPETRSFYELPPLRTITIGLQLNF